MLIKDKAYRVVGCCMEVHKVLGGGLLEQCYHIALYYELKAAGYSSGCNVPYSVLYKGETVGEYFADLVVDNELIVEIKSVRALNDVHMAQLINYLHISGCRAGLLVNFRGSSLEWRRVVL